MPVANSGASDVVFNRRLTDEGFASVLLEGLSKRKERGDHGATPLKDDQVMFIKHHGYSLDRFYAELSGWRVAYNGTGYAAVRHRFAGVIDDAFLSQFADEDFRHGCEEEAWAAARMVDDLFDMQLLEVISEHPECSENQL